MTTKDTLPTHTGTPPKALVAALKKLLRPLVRLLLSFQITLPFLVELLKEVYVDVAEKDFPLDNKKQTDTRISMLTGVHRKDTKRLRNQDVEEESSPTNVSIGVQLATKWISDPNYLDSKGNPLPLPLKSTDGQVDFEALVQSVCKQDMRARVILDEWLRLGIATLKENEQTKEHDLVVLDTQGFIPSKGLDEKAYYLGMNLSDHLEAASHNLLADKPPFLERCVYYSGLSDSSIKKLEAEAKEKGMALLKDLNKQAMALQKKDKESFSHHDTQIESEPKRMNFGLYFYSESEAKDDDQA